MLVIPAVCLPSHGCGGDRRRLDLITTTDTPRDTAQQRAVLRQTRIARTVRAQCPVRSRVHVRVYDKTGRTVVAPSVLRAEARRHVVNARGGRLTVRWGNGHVGGMTPINLEGKPR